MAKKEESRILQIVVLEPDCILFLNKLNESFALQRDAAEQHDRDDGSD